MIIFVFIVSFSLIFFSLSKLFKTNKAIASIVSLATSFLVTYGVSKYGINFRDFFSSLGISAETLAVLIPILLLALAIFLVIQFKGKSFLIFGALLIASAFFIEEEEIVIVVGAILLLIGFLSLSKKGKKSQLEKVVDLFDKKK